MLWAKHRSSDDTDAAVIHSFHPRQSHRLIISEIALIVFCYIRGTWLVTALVDPKPEFRAFLFDESGDNSGSGGQPAKKAGAVHHGARDGE